MSKITFDDLISNLKSKIEGEDKVTKEQKQKLEEMLDKVVQDRKDILSLLYEKERLDNAKVEAIQAQLNEFKKEMSRLKKLTKQNKKLEIILFNLKKDKIELKTNKKIVLSPESLREVQEIKKREEEEDYWDWSKRP